MVNTGRIRDAIARDIRDIRSKFGTKYNVGILEMLRYAREQDYILKILPEELEVLNYE